MSATYLVQENTESECIGSPELKQRLAENRQRGEEKQQEAFYQRFREKQRRLHILLSSHGEFLSCQQINEFVDDGEPEDTAFNETTFAIADVTEWSQSLYFPPPEFDKAILIKDVEDSITDLEAEDVSAICRSRIPKLEKTVIYWRKRRWHQKWFSKHPFDRPGDDFVFRLWVTELYLARLECAPNVSSWRYCYTWNRKTSHDARATVDGKEYAIHVGRYWKAKDVIAFHEQMQQEQRSYQIW